MLENFPQTSGLVSKKPRLVRQHEPQPLLGVQQKRSNSLHQRDAGNGERRVATKLTVATASPENWDTATCLNTPLTPSSVGDYFSPHLPEKKDDPLPAVIRYLEEELFFEREKVNYCEKLLSCERSEHHQTYRLLLTTEQENKQLWQERNGYNEKWLTTAERFYALLTENHRLHRQITKNVRATAADQKKIAQLQRRIRAAKQVNEQQQTLLVNSTRKGTLKSRWLLIVSKN